jgi:hypothetical protein
VAAGTAFFRPPPSHPPAGSFDDTVPASPETPGFVPDQRRQIEIREPAQDRGQRPDRDLGKARRAVATAVVQEHDVAGNERGGRSAGDRFGRLSRPPLAPPAGPEEGRPAVPPHQRERGDREDAVGRPVEDRPAPGRGSDYRLAALEIGIQVPGRAQEQRPVQIAVQPDLVPGRRDLGGESGMALDLLADEEEGRAHPRLGQ